MKDRYEPLVVYHPVVHGGRARGVAKSLGRIGMQMMVTGPTAVEPIQVDHKFTTQQAREIYGDNVFATESDEILKSPPDVIILGREDNLKSTQQLRRKLNRIKPVAVVGYSGVFQSQFQYRKLDGLIATDKASRAVARYRGIPAVKFYPEFAFDDWPYVPEPAQDRVILRSFVRGYKARFPLSYEFHEACKKKLAEEFGDKVLIENYEDAGSKEVRALMRESTASLHIKDEEGFGWSTVESLSMGRPIIWQAGLSRSMAFREWLPDQGAEFRIVTPEDLVPIVARLLTDPQWRRDVQEEAAKTVRATFDVHRNAENLGDFLMTMHHLASFRWTPWHRGPAGEDISRYVASLDPDVLQDFERVALGGKRAEDIDNL